MRRARRRVTGSDAIGPYTLLRVDRGGLDTGVPGQFFMLEAPGRVLPRPMSLCLASAGELSFLIDPIGPGTRALCGMRPGEELHVLGPLGHGFDLEVARPLLVGGGIGVAPLPFLSEALGGPPALLGFRSDWHAEAAALVPNAEVCVEPTFVTELLPQERLDVLACGPEPMLAALRELVPGRPARVGGSDGLWLRRLLRLRSGGRRGAEATLRRGAGPPRATGARCSQQLRLRAAQRLRLPRRARLRPTWREPSMPS